MKSLVNEKLEEFETTGKKIAVSEISRIIQYKDRSRIRNTIKALIGNAVYEQIFGGPKPAYDALSIEQIDRLVKETGLSKYGIEGLITDKGVQLLRDALAGNIPLSKAKFEIWCQVKEHKPFNAWWGNLKKGQYCRLCNADGRAFTYSDAIELGLENGYYLKETSETMKQKILDERGNKPPSQVLLDWVCEHDHPNKKRLADISRLGCSDCYRIGRSITFSQAQDLASQKGYTLDMTPAQFKKAIDEGNKKGIKPSLVKLKWSCGQHSWTTSYQSMKGTGTCPTCQSGYYESRTRRIIENTFPNMKFPQVKVRDIIPKANVHGKMHFDGYAEFVYAGKIVKVAIEFQGYQHYDFPNVFHRSYQQFQNLRINDAKKATLANNNDIILITVPHTLCKLSNANQRVQDHIVAEFERRFSEIFGVSQFKFDPRGLGSLGLGKFLGTP